jgi:hypothetical protein
MKSDVTGIIEPGNPGENGNFAFSFREVQAKVDGLVDMHG